jgi:cytochrome c peroxidase
LRGGASAKRGWEIFNTTGRCNKCHALTEEKRDLTNFTDNDFHNIGIGIIRHNVAGLARQAERQISRRALEPLHSATANDTSVVMNGRPPEAPARH